jgi:hypothetical protein
LLGPGVYVNYWDRYSIVVITYFWEKSPCVAEGGKKRDIRRSL